MMTTRTTSSKSTLLLLQVLLLALPLGSSSSSALAAQPEPKNSKKAPVSETAAPTTCRASGKDGAGCFGDQVEGEDGVSLLGLRAGAVLKHQKFDAQQLEKKKKKGTDDDLCEDSHGPGSQAWYHCTEGPGGDCYSFYHGCVTNGDGCHTAHFDQHFSDSCADALAYCKSWAKNKDAFGDSPTDAQMGQVFGLEKACGCHCRLDAGGDGGGTPSWDGDADGYSSWGGSGVDYGEANRQ